MSTNLVPNVPFHHYQLETAPGNPSAYSHAVKAGDLLFVSGCIGLGMNLEFTSDTIEGQTEQSLKNLITILEGAHSSPALVAKVTIFLSDMKHYSIVNQIYAKHFPIPLPARSCIAVAALPRGALIEVEAIAVIGQQAQ